MSVPRAVTNLASETLGTTSIRLTWDIETDSTQDSFEVNRFTIRFENIYNGHVCLNCRFMFNQVELLKLILNLFEILLKHVERELAKRNTIKLNFILVQPCKQKCNLKFNQFNFNQVEHQPATRNAPIM